jgi:hypothetical protein
LNSLSTLLRVAIQDACHIAKSNPKIHTTVQNNQKIVVNLIWESTKVIELKKPGSFIDDPLTEILREGARKLL